MVRLKFYLAAGASALLMTGCAVGPDFRPSAELNPVSYASTTLSAETGAAPGLAGESQHFETGRNIPAEWWTLFRSPGLDQLMQQAIADSPTIESAEAAVRRAREELRALSGSTYFPSVDASASITRSRFSGARFGQPGASFSPFTLYNASVNVSYDLDIFGGSRREVEALRAQVDYERFLLEAAHLALAANIVTAAVQDASLRGQIRAVRELLAAQEEQLGIVEGRFQAGAASRTDVLLQRATVSQTRAAIVPLEKVLSATRHQLAALAGRLPADAAQLPTFELDSFALPRELPVSLPSALARQRPDIRAAEAVLHAACAQVGAATANLYPRITLTGSYGSEATRTGDLFSAGSAVWNLGAGLLQPLFRGGELRAKRRAAVAVYDSAAAGYRETVLQAFRNVADTLRALELDAEALGAEAEAEQAARESFETAQKQFRLGAVSHLAVLVAESRYRETRVALVQAQAARFADTAALFQALGGGWWNRVKTEEDQEKAKAE